jgi:hypothetical protein
LLAFGEAFDPEIPNPGFDIGFGIDGLDGLGTLTEAQRRALVLSRGMEGRR